MVAWPELSDFRASGETEDDGAASRPPPLFVTASNPVRPVPLPKARCLRQPTRGCVVSTDQPEVLPSFRWSGGTTLIRRFQPVLPMPFASAMFKRTAWLGA